MNQPSDYNLPSHHTSWRQYQYESVQWALGVSGVGILSAPVGSGKTGVAKGVSSRKDVIALAQTKLLQESVYTEHGFDILKGKANYYCINGVTEKADTCPLDKMPTCLDAWNCPYLIAKSYAMSSPAASINYAYFLSSPHIRMDPPEVLFLDECHLLPEIVLGFIGIGIDKKTMSAWSLHPPPNILANLEMDLSGDGPPALKGSEYLRSIQTTLKPQVDKSKADIKRFNWGKRLLGNIARTAQLIENEPELWFVEADKERFRAKPLTARYHYGNLFDISPVSILMSATVGDFDTLAAELGIAEYVTRDVPSRYDPARRPVVALDSPPLGYKSEPQDYEYQADAIANAIKSFDPTWSGIIHVNRKDAAPLLADRLARRGLQDRVWVTPVTDDKGRHAGTDYQMSSWIAHKRKSGGGQLAIAWSWHEGVDLGEEKICVCAKVPFCSLGDPYEKARFNFSRSFYAQRAAWELQQQLGRTRRGNEEDYDTEDDVRGLVAIADGNWTRVRSYLSNDFVESIVDVKEVA